MRHIEEVLAQVDLLDHLGKRMRDMSIGMEIRLKLARALLHDPEPQLLDEPTGELRRGDSYDYLLPAGEVCLGALLRCDPS